MAVRPVISIEVDDAAWKKFQAAYAEYQTGLSQTSTAWAKVSEKVGLTAAEMDGLAESTTALASASRSRAAIDESVASQLKRQSNETERQSNLWRDMAKDSKNFAAHIGTATTSLLRWASITGIISGILGAGGLFGIERLAVSASGQRQGAAGINVSPGEKSAFELNFGRVLGNPGGFLTGVYESLGDVTKAAPYGAIGLNYNQERSKNPADAALDVLRGLKDLADKTDQKSLGTTFSSRQLGQFGISLEDFQVIKNRSRAELSEYGQHFQKDRRDLNIADPTAKAWEDLKVQLERASTLIKNAFIDNLAPLVPQIEGLSKDVAELVKDFLTGGTARAAIESFRDGIKWLDDTIKDPKFKDDLRYLVTGLGDLAHSVAKALHWIGLGSDRDTPEDSDDKKKAWDEEEKRRLAKQKAWDDAHSGGSSSAPDPDASGASPGSRGSRSLNTPLPWAGSVDPSFHRDGKPNGGSAPPPDFMPGGGSSYLPMAFRPGDFSSGISPALLASVEWQESRGKDVTNQKSGAAGYFQFMPSTAAQYGVDVHNEQSSMAGAYRYLTDLEKQFGSTEKALAAYNWGPGNLKREIARYGADWRDHLPDETDKYVRSILSRVRGAERPDSRGTRPPAPAGQYAQQFVDRSMTVKIQNNTGGNANVTFSQLSA